MVVLAALMGSPNRENSGTGTASQAARVEGANDITGPVARSTLMAGRTGHRNRAEESRTTWVAGSRVEMKIARSRAKLKKGARTIGSRPFFQNRTRLAR